MNTFDIENFLRNLTTRPGVYVMLDEAGNVIYVGKAKNLKKRITTYFQRQLDSKTLNLVKNIRNIEVTVTRNEREALLLESNLIKEWMPKYNVIFKDDKSIIDPIQSHFLTAVSQGDTFQRLKSFSISKLCQKHMRSFTFSIDVQLCENCSHCCRFSCPTNPKFHSSISRTI